MQTVPPLRTALLEVAMFHERRAAAIEAQLRAQDALRVKADVDRKISQAAKDIAVGLNF